MHEASIAQSIIEIADRHCVDAGYTVIRNIRVRVGTASSVMPEALAPAFEIVRMGTRAESAELIVERVPLGGTCRACAEPFTTEEPFMLACPACGSGDFAFESGRELDIVDIEVD